MCQFQPGYYFIGDLTYVTDSLQKLNKQKIFYQKLENNCEQCSDNNGNVYILTSVLGICPVDFIKLDLQQLEDIGVVYKFKQKFQSYEQDGVFYFGHIIVDTNQKSDYQDLDFNIGDQQQ